MPTEPLHEHDPHALPDSEFVPGSLGLIRVGNTGRMLDPRRTPVTITDVLAEIGMFQLEVNKFEDEGVRWTLPLEDVSGFQFAKDSQPLDKPSADTLAESVRRFDKPLAVEPEAIRLEQTLERVQQRAGHARAWLEHHSDVVTSNQSLDTDTSEGPPPLRTDLKRYMGRLGLAGIEQAVADTWVSNPRSGEIISGHQIVMAGLGLAPFNGKALRDPRSMAGKWGLERREEHILSRLGFLRALFSIFDVDLVVLYRSLSFESPPPDEPQATLISATFRLSVAEAWLNADPLRYSAQVMRQPVPVDRLFMTYLETDSMNQKYKESEAVLFTQPRGALF